ncbi:MAG: sulfotransferase [Verrucomicrobia bacterium]|nr:MAG: sulfotransferase [Verrucomicrobiota bacterium]
MFGFGRHPVEKLDFLVAGAQKSGTTALNYYLTRHPRIALPIKKELHFFDNDDLFAGGNVSYEPLHDMFRPARPGSIAGENTPIYLYWRPALPRIRNYNPEMKFIVILRNPIERAFSQWNMQRLRGNEPFDFVEAVQAEARRIADAAPKQLRKFSYLDRGRYAEQLERAFRLFPRERFLILKYETFRARQREMIDEVFRFLNLTPVRFRAVEAHDIPYSRKIRAEERAAVWEILKSDIGGLETLLEWDCSDWR